MINKIKTITLGVRFSKSFRVIDISGEIADDILYKKGSPFNNMFEKVLESSRDFEKILVGKGAVEHLNINNSNIILRVKVDQFNQTFARIKNKFLPHIVDIFNERKIKDINRLGIIFNHQSVDYGGLSDVVGNFSGNRIIDPNNVSLYFSKKIGIDNIGGAREGNRKDYKNTIYSFIKDEEGITVDLDYQHYFDPPKEDIRDCKPDDFLTKSRLFLEENFYKWIDNNVKA